MKKWCVGLLGLILLGISIGSIYKATYGPASTKWLDGQFFYVAGTMWAHGDNPYDFFQFSREWQNLAQVSSDDNIVFRENRSFIYPPTTSILAVPIAALSPNTGELVYDLLSITALIIALIFFSLLLKNTGNLPDWPTRLLVLGLSGLVAAVPTTLHLGQTGLFALCGVACLIYSDATRKPFLGVVSILLLSFKPQLTILVAVYSILSGGFRVLFIGLLLCLAISVLTVALNIGSIPTTILESMRIHTELPFNNSQNYHDAFSIFVPYFGQLTSLAGIFFALCLVTLLAFKGIPFCDHSKSNNYALLFAISLAFLPLHSYDWILLIGVISLLNIGASMAVNFLMSCVLISLTRLSSINMVLNFSGSHFDWQPWMSSILFLLVTIIWIYINQKVASISTSPYPTSSKSLSPIG